MSALPILKYPHPTLRRSCTEATVIDDDLRRLADDMCDTMSHANGIGLAAPQVGRHVRLLVADVSETKDNPIKLANPRIVHHEGETLMEEGCLSVPGVTAAVSRAKAVVVVGLNMNGEETRLEAEDLLAICLQHEIDHLNGVLFFDHISRLKRNLLLGKYKKLQKAQEKL